MARRRTLLLLALIILATITPMATARACSCMMPDATRFLAESDFVFAGSLIERPAGVGAIGELGADNVPYTFEVDAVYKGDLRDSTVEVWSASNGAACGFEVPVGEPVAIAASLSGGQLTGGLCATFGVDQLEAAAADAGFDPTSPAASPPPTVGIAGEQPQQTPESARGIVIATAVAGIAALGLALALRRGRRA
jgi:hypothetical protein